MNYEEEVAEAKANEALALIEAGKLLDEIETVFYELQDALKGHDIDEHYGKLEAFIKAREADLNAPSNSRQYLTFSAGNVIKHMIYRDQSRQNATNILEDAGK